MGQSFYPTLVELAKIGAAGVGIAIFLMVFLMIFRGKPVDPDTARLRETFLKLGVVFAIVVGAMALIPPLIQKQGGPVSMRLAFSPDFDTEKLSPPKIRLPDGSLARPDQNIALMGSGAPQVVTIGMDAALKEVRNLRDASAALADSVTKVQEQRDALVTSADTAASMPRVQGGLEAQSTAVEQLQTEVTRSLQTGDYERASRLSSRLRTSVLKAGPVVAEIAAER